MKKEHKTSRMININSTEVNPCGLSLGHDDPYRRALERALDEIERRKEEFVRERERDFTRNRRLTFSRLMRTIIGMGGGTISSELMEIYERRPGNLLPQSPLSLRREKNSPLRLFMRL